MGAERGIYRSLRPISVSSSKKTSEKTVVVDRSRIHLKKEGKTKLHTCWFLLCELSNQNYLFENEKRMITEEMRGTRELRFDSPPLMFHWH